MSDTNSKPKVTIDVNAMQSTVNAMVDHAIRNVVTEVGALYEGISPIASILCISRAMNGIAGAIAVEVCGVTVTEKVMKEVIAPEAIRATSHSVLAAVDIAMKDPTISEDKLKLYRSLSRSARKQLDSLDEDEDRTEEGEA